MSSHVNILNALLSSAICALVRSRNPWIMNKERRILQRLGEIFQFLGVKHVSTRPFVMAPISKLAYSVFCFKTLLLVLI